MTSRRGPWIDASICVKRADDEPTRSRGGGTGRGPRVSVGATRRKGRPDVRTGGGGEKETGGRSRQGQTGAKASSHGEEASEAGGSTGDERFRGEREAAPRGYSGPRHRRARIANRV